jgi:hypothetical protein
VKHTKKPVTTIFERLGLADDTELAYEFFRELMVEKAGEASPSFMPESAADEARRMAIAAKAGR